jgi:HD superfamily phosphodiesterase
MMGPDYNEALGHGLFHSRRVSIDCAASIHIETGGERMKPVAVERLMVNGIYAGLLHDICRDEQDHARCGAEKAENVLRTFSLSKNEIACTANAIRNHEALLPATAAARQWAQLVSDCLYDADQFRWGADIFTHTLWHMMDYQALSPRDLIEKFPRGMSGTVRIIETFRTPTGRLFDPEIIQTGMEMEKEICRYLLQRHRE